MMDLSPNHDAEVASSSIGGKNTRREEASELGVLQQVVAVGEARAIRN